jgi:MFS family permease
MPAQQRSFAGVVEDIVGNVQGIIRSEVRLAKTEIREETAKAGRASGILGGGAVLALYALGFALLAGFFALEYVVAPWLSALIVAVVTGIVAAILGTMGWKRLKQAHPRPEKTIDTIKDNVKWAKELTK